MAEAAKYEPDEDGYVREVVGSWVQDKHTRLARYIGISRSVRAKFIGAGNAGATFIDLYSGPGRLRISSETQAIHGSPLVAWHEAVDSGAAFTEVHVADADPEMSEAVGARLRKIRAPVFAETGPADQTVDRVIAKLNPYALHFAFLDPYNLGALPFEIIHSLAKMKRMDILIHMSVQDLQRNLQRYIDKQNSPLDVFAPGWRAHVDVSRSDELIRAKYLEYWRSS
jgi:three-Cys-motif partner protein